MKIHLLLKSLIFLVTFLSTVTIAAAEMSKFKRCTGEIYSTSDRKVISLEEAIRAIRSSDVVIFGERDTSVEHAIASSCAFEAFVDNGQPASLVMEVISKSYTSKIAAYRQNPESDAASLGVHLQWWESGWPSFLNWLPLIEKAFQFGVPILGGDAELNDISARPLREDEEEKLQEVFGDRLDEIRHGWQEAINGSHCGLIDPQEAARLTDHQIRRDLTAVSVTNERLHSGEKVYIHANRGHARKDRSIIPALDLTGGKKVLSIAAFHKIDLVREDQWDTFDLIWLTGDAGRPDVCSVLNSGSE